MKTNDIKDVFETLLLDIYDAELKLKKELPKLAKKAKNADLSAEIQKDARLTEEQLERLETVFEKTGASKKDHECRSMNGYISEVNDMIAGAEEGPVRDLILVAYGKKIGHYQIASYEVLSNLAEGLFDAEVSQLLKLNLKANRDMEGHICELGRKDIGPDAVRKAA